MLNLKKTAVAVLAFGSSAVFAGTMGPVCAPGNATVPCEKTAWDFGVQALYLQPSFSNFGYLGTGPVAAVNATTGYDTTQYNRWNPSYSWGFKLEGSYHFGQGNDVNLNWYHINRSKSKNIVVGANFVEPAFAFGTAVPSRFTVKPQWDAVNLEFGQHVDFTEASSARLHAGLAYVRLSNKFSGTSYGGTGYATASGFNTYNFNTDLKFNGIGARTGVDAAYDWGNGLGIYGNAAAALFAGETQFTLNSYQGLNSVFNYVSAATRGKTTTVVPELEAKLGAKYTYAMAQGDLSLDIGWMWVNYFHAQQLGTAVAGKATGVDESDFSLQGPYIGLKWVGNVA